MSDPQQSLLSAHQGTTQIEDVLQTELSTKLPAADLASVLSLVHAANVQQNYHLGPKSNLHADDVERLEALAPGFGSKYADAFIAGIYSQMEWDKEDQSILRDGQKRGMNFGLVVSLSLIAGAVYCAHVEATAIGIALVGASALGMVGKFIDGRRNK